jgi:malate synthase
VTGEVLAPLGIAPETFWDSVAEIIRQFGSRNAELLGIRDDLQRRVDVWHRDHHGAGDPAEYRAFLGEIGYLEPEPGPFSILVDNVDEEIAHVAGPQLVVPLSNARFALNAVNARWGSLFDALYGTDVISDEGGAGRGAGYNEERGRRVTTYVGEFLDDVAPLVNASHTDAVEYTIDCGDASGLIVRLADGRSTRLADPSHFLDSADDGIQDENSSASPRAPRRDLR